MQHRGGFTDGPDPHRKKAPHFAKGDEAENREWLAERKPKNKKPRSAVRHSICTC